mgnify:FL=1
MKAIRETDFKQELRAARLMEKAVIEALKDGDQFKRYIVTEKQGGDTVTEEYVFDKYDFKAMGEMVKVVKSLEELKRSASGMTGVQEGGLVVLPEAGE